MSTTSEKKKRVRYDAGSISVLEGLEPVRKRPGMYIGDTEEYGYHHLFKEVLDNSVDEAMVGVCDKITVTLHEDGQTVTVEDNGRGIPVDQHPVKGIPVLELVLTTLHAGGKFGSEGYNEAGGLHGVGVSCVNALAEFLEAKVWRNNAEEGKVGIFEQRFEKSAAVTQITQTSPNTSKHGTSITYKADPEFFRDIKFNQNTIKQFLNEAAFLNAGLTLVFVNKSNGQTETYYHEGGIADYIKILNKSKEDDVFDDDEIRPAESDRYRCPDVPFFAQGEVALTDSTGKPQLVKVQYSFQYTEKDGEKILSYANNIYTVNGGTHITGFKQTFTRIVNTFARSLNLLKDKDANLSEEDIRDGITAIISVRLPQPQFEGQTKGKLGSASAKPAVSQIVTTSLSEFFEKNPSVIKSIVERALMSQKAREAAKRQSDAVKKQTNLNSKSFLGKLKDCTSRKREEREIFVVEGDSAAGSGKDGRNKHTQAILPIRGKIINAAKHDLLELMNNKEIQSLIAAIGAGVEVEGQSQFKLDSRRYEKIIIMTDADVDGSHIAILLLTFLYRFMRPLIENGNVYLAQPPLYRVDTGKGKNVKSTYLWTDEELAKHPPSGKKIVRFKGLGEMNAKELGATTMHPDTRKLIQVTVEDLHEAEHTLSMLMGKDSAARMNFIVEQSQYRGN
jgi:DNA gyrase subunit B